MKNMQAEERINILLVDDSPTNLLALESILRAADRNLISASCGEDALRYLLDNEAAVVLLDVYMPGIDGLETAELIRSREKSRDIPIIFLTANTTGVTHLSRGYSLGAVDYIVKPVDPEILRSKVAVFVELFKKTREIRHQAQLLHEKNLELENANLARLNMLIDLGHELAAEHDPAQVLGKFCRSSRKIVGAEEAAVGLLGNDGQSLRHFFSCTSHKEGVSENGMPAVVHRALDRLLSEQRPLRLSESDDVMLDAENDSDSVQSFLGAPILSASGILGWFYLLNKVDADDFSQADERLAATLATQVAVAYENASLYSEAQSHAAELRAEMAVRKQAEEERAQLLIREQAARAEAEMANRTKDEFLAILSHELRTPLSAILGWSHLVRTNKLGETEMAHGLETIERNARVQSQLIDDLLDVSRIITGKLEIESRAVDVSTVIAAAIDSVRPAFEAKEIEFESVLESPACFVLGEAARLQQIFWNLFSNAVKFTPKRGRVTVTLQRREAQVQISVTDTGAGISSEFLPYIFDRFRQADASTTRAHGGLGLGLAIVRHLVELHQGKVDVKSHGAGRGSTFTVTLPIASVPALTTADGVLLQPDNNLSLYPANIFDGVRILVVDDEIDACDLLTAILTRCGSEVRCSGSAAEAIQTFEEWKPDLLITDIGMPNEDGYSLIRKLRALSSERAKRIPAVALTAYATDEDRSLALSAGFKTHLTKPIEPKSLVTSIAAILERESAFQISLKSVR
jgi:signal transduction histidine kinase/DNA-binding response OmpR family regulator